MFSEMFNKPITGQPDGQVKISHVMDACISKQGLTFIEVGANDGKSNDPLAEYIIPFNWKGIMIEPVEKCFRVLQANYCNVPDIKCEQVAIFPGAETVSMYVPKNTLAASLNPKHTAFGGKAKEVIVPATTLDAIVQKHGIKELDLLYIDAEGFDFVVLQTLTMVRPKIIHYEHRHLGEQKAQCEEFLLKKGYCLYFNRNNTIAIEIVLTQDLLK